MIGHDRLNITASVRTSVMTFVTTPASADVNAPWAPITSLFKRLTRAPVWVRVKNAIGIDWTCSNTRRRRSRINRSPRRDDARRSSIPTAAPTTATSARSTAIVTTMPPSRCSTIASTARPASTGVRTPRIAATVARARNAAIVRPWGRANDEHAAPRLTVDAAAGTVVLHGALQRVPHLEVGHEEHATGSTSLEVNVAARGRQALTGSVRTATVIRLAASEYRRRMRVFLRPSAMPALRMVHRVCVRCSAPAEGGGEEGAGVGVELGRDRASRRSRRAAGR